jgi:hypothetical protein
MEMVDIIVDRLESDGNEVWMDRRGISGGKKWRTQIVNAINESDLFIVFLSQDSIFSDNVETELTLAHKKGLYIIPVLLDDVEVTQEMEYQLAGLQQIDCSDLSDASIDQLLQTIYDYDVEVDYQDEEYDESEGEVNYQDEEYDESEEEMDYEDEEYDMDDETFDDIE